jgi:hypothetical protein
MEFTNFANFNIILSSNIPGKKRVNQNYKNLLKKLLSSRIKNFMLLY